MTLGNAADQRTLTTFLPAANAPKELAKNRMTYRTSLGLIFALALALRLGVTGLLQGLDSPPRAEANPDQVEYERFGWRLAHGQGYTWETGEPTAARPPGTALVLVPVYQWFGHSFRVGRLWFCLLSALTCLATAWAVKYSFDSAVALVAALGVAVYPGHFYYSMHFLSEVPFTLWLMLTLGCAVRALDDHGGRIYAVGAGVFGDAQS